MRCSKGGVSKSFVCRSCLILLLLSFSFPFFLFLVLEHLAVAAAFLYNGHLHGDRPGLYKLHFHFLDHSSMFLIYASTQRTQMASHQKAIDVRFNPLPACTEATTSTRGEHFLSLCIVNA